MFFDKDKSVFSFGEGLRYPFQMVFLHLKDFFSLVVFFSFLNTAVSMLLGRNIACSLPKEYVSNLFCSYNVFSVVVTFVLGFVCLGVFINRWQMVFSKNISFVKSLRESCYKNDLKAIFMIFLFVCLWSVVLYCGMVLKQRVPLENWVHELAFFVGVSLCIVFAVILLLNFVIFQHFLNGGRFFEIKKTFWPILDNFYKILWWFSFYFFLFVLSISSVFRMVFSMQNIVLNFVNVFVIEFMISFILYIFVAFFSSLLFYQEKQIFKDEKES